jgi:hypothetical protein
MDIKELLTYDVIIAIIIFVICIVLIVYFKGKESVENLENNQNNQGNNQSNNLNSNVKKLYYFGGHHCPHSNQQSDMYKFITERFASAHPNVELQILWGSDEKAQEMYQKHNVEYVPTLVNKDGTKINVQVPDGIDTQGKGDQEIENIVIKNVFSQL